MEDQQFPSLLPFMFFLFFVTAGPVLLTFCLLMQIECYSPSSLTRSSQLGSLSEIFLVLFPLREILCSILLGSQPEKKVNRNGMGEKRGIDWCVRVNHCCIFTRERGEKLIKFWREERYEVRTESRCETENSNMDIC